MSSKVLIILVINVAACYALLGGSISNRELGRALSDRAYMQRQLRCALGQGACDKVGNILKSVAPFILKGSCSICTSKEQRQLRSILYVIRRNFPREYKLLQRRYRG